MGGSVQGQARLNRVTRHAVYLRTGKDRTGQCPYVPARSFQISPIICYSFSSGLQWEEIERCIFNDSSEP